MLDTVIVSAERLQALIQGGGELMVFDCSADLADPAAGAAAWRARRIVGSVHAPLETALSDPGVRDADPSAEARFAREAKTLAGLSHPNLLELLDHGVDPSEGPYLVTPLIEGETLRALAARAGTNMPPCPRSCASATDCNRRVFPPELGPVMSNVVSARSVTTSHGTALLPWATSSGLKRPRSTRGPGSAASSERSSGRLTSRPAASARSLKPSAPR